MEPLAGTYFLKRVLQLTPAKDEWEHFPMIADFNTQIPSRTRSLLYNEESPAPKIIQTIGNLQTMGVDLVAVPCNSAHGWYEEVSGYISIPWLNMIKITSDVVKSFKVESILVVGAYVTVVKKLYDKYLDNTVYMDSREYKKLFELIAKLKVGADKNDVKQKLRNLTNKYRGEAEGILIACTEPSMLFGIDEKYWNGFRIIDSTNEYAKKCVEICK